MLKRFAIALLLIALVPLPFRSESRAVEPEFDIAIINGRIVDGTGNPWFYGAVAIKGDRIVQVGAVDAQRAARVIDAKGMIVAPGFIDVHTHVEGNLMAVPTADNFIYMGVTSLVTGNCGSSALQVGDFLSELVAKGISVNIATLVGHGPVRRVVWQVRSREPSA